MSSDQLSSSLDDGLTHQMVWVPLSFRVIPYLLGERLEIRPSFLHGDLWVRITMGVMVKPLMMMVNWQSGNVGRLSDGSPVMYDPSSYFGHNEAE